MGRQRLYIDVEKTGECPNPQVESLPFVSAEVWAEPGAPGGDVSSAASTDIREFGEFYRAHYAFVCAVLRRHGIGHSEVEDVAQEVFIVALRRLSSLESADVARGWLFTIARYATLNHRRRSARYRRKVSELAIAFGREPQAHDTHEVEQVAMRGMVCRLLNDLPDFKRDAFVMRHALGMSSREIATATGVGHHTARSRVHQARIALARACSSEFSDLSASMDNLVVRTLEQSRPTHDTHTRQRQHGFILLLLALGIPAEGLEVRWPPAPGDSIGRGSWSSKAPWVGAAVAAGFAALLGIRGASVAADDLDAGEPELAPTQETSGVQQSAGDDSKIPNQSVSTIDGPKGVPKTTVPPTRAVSGCRARTRKPQSDVALLNKATRDIDVLGNYERALKTLDRHECYFPKISATARQIYRIRALCQLGRPLAAKASLIRRRKIDPNESSIQRALAECP